MKAIEQIERMQKMIKFIRGEKTGTPHEFSKLLGISRSQLYKEIEYFKDNGAQIEYSRRRETFYFANESDVEVFQHIKIIPGKGLRDIDGGRCCSNDNNMFVLN